MYVLTGNGFARAGAIIGTWFWDLPTAPTDISSGWEANGRVEHSQDGTPQSFPGVLIDVEERRAVEAERD